MKKLVSILGVAAFMGAMVSAPANAFWGGGGPWGGSPYNSGGYGGGPWQGMTDMFGGGDINFNAKSYGRGNASGYGNPYYGYNSGYGGYPGGYGGYPGGYGGYPGGYGGFPRGYGGYPGGYGAPVAPPAPAPAQ